LEATNSTVTKKFKTSKAKVVKVKKEGNDDFQPPIIATSDDLVSSDRRVLRQRGSNGKVSAEPKEVNAATQSPPSRIVVLKINAERFRAFLNRASSPKKKRTIFRRSRSNPYTNRYRFEFGEDRLPHHSEPTPQSLKEVAEILEKERMTLTNGALVTAEAFTPFHGGNRLTVDALVRVIIAQACTNEVATEVQQTMRLAYPYHVNGKKVVGEKPNYHDVRMGSVKKLENVIKKGGLIFKAQKIKDCLDTVFTKNVALLQPGEVEYALNKPTATDFVPGLLSMEYIYTIYKEGGKQAAFDSLIELPLMGVKSVCCLMGFHMRLPVFAVDTHVANMAKLLG
jgi:endonuclease III